MRATTCCLRGLFAAIVITAAACASGNGEGTSDVSSESVATTGGATTVAATQAPATTSPRDTRATSAETSDEPPPTTPLLSAPVTPPPDGPALATLCPDATVVDVAFDRDSGDLLWRTCADAGVNRQIVGAVDDLYYALDYPEPGPEITPLQLVASSVADGGEQWRAPLATSFATLVRDPLVGSGIIVASADDEGGEPGAPRSFYGRAVGIDASTGQEVWTVSDRRFTRIAGATDDVVVLVSDFAEDVTTMRSEAPPDERYVRGVDRADGTPLWETTIELRPADDPFPTSVSDGDVVVFHAGGLVAVDAAAGRVLWHEQAPDGTLGGASDGVVVTGGQDDELEGWTLGTGVRSWTGAGAPPYDDTWAIGDGAVVVVDGVGGAIVAYDLATGDVRWRTPWDPARYAWPFHADDDTAFLLWWNVDAVSTDDGSPRWSTDFAPDGQHRFASAAANADTLVTNVSSRPPG